VIYGWISIGLDRMTLICYNLKMNNKTIKILIVLSIFVAFSFVSENVFAKSLADSYTESYNRTIINSDDLRSRSGNGYDTSDTQRETDNNQYSNNDRVNTNTNKSTSTKSSGTTINNYYSLFSNYGTKTTSDNSSSVNNKVATTTKSKNSTSTDITDKTNTNTKETDSKYGGAVDVTGRNLGASAGVVGGFLPETFGGWLVTIFLILVLIILIRLITKPKKKKEEPRY